MAAAFIEAGVGKGTRVGLIMPNGVQWVQIARGAHPHRRRAGPAEHPAAAPRSWSRNCGSPPCSTWSRSRSSAATATSTTCSPSDTRRRNCLRCARFGRPTSCRELAGGDQRIVDAMAADRHAAADTLVIMFTSGSSGPPKGVIHSHGNALGAVRSGLAARCIDADTRLYLPMPFFWVGGFGSGILSALLAGATLVTEEIPQPETTLRLLERERVTLFRGWPDQAEALARQSDSVGADLSALRPGSLEALLPADQRAEPGARAQVVRDDRGVRALLRLSRRHRHAAIGMGQLRQAVRRAWRSASSTPTPANPCPRARSA